MKPRLRSLLWSVMALTLLLAGTTLVRAYDILLRRTGEQLVL